MGIIALHKAIKQQQQQQSIHLIGGIFAFPFLLRVWEANGFVTSTC